MGADRLARVVARLQNLPEISLPTDFPRPTGGNRLVEAAATAELSDQTCVRLMKLALYNENDDDADDDSTDTDTPSAFHLLLAAFSVLLYRFTGDTDLIIGSSSTSARDPLVLRIHSILVIHSGQSFATCNRLKRKPKQINFRTRKLYVQ